MWIVMKIKGIEGEGVSKLLACTECCFDYVGMNHLVN